VDFDSSTDAPIADGRSKTIGIPHHFEFTQMDRNELPIGPTIRARYPPACCFSKPITPSKDNFQIASSNSWASSSAVYCNTETL
jgi:hypothetical protein